MKKVIKTTLVVAAVVTTVAGITAIGVKRYMDTLNA